AKIDPRRPEVPARHPTPASCLRCPAQPAQPVVDDAATSMPQYQKDVEHSEGDGRDGEEVNRGDLVSVVFQEGPPRLRGRLGVTDHVPGDRGLGHRVAQQKQLGQNLRSAPCRVLARHATDQVTDLAVNLGPAELLAGLPPPVKPNPCRCQRVTVSGWTMNKADRQPFHSRDSQDQKIRSSRRRFGRLTDRCRTSNCCRRARFSAARDARGPNSTLQNARIHRKMPIAMPPPLAARPESHDNGPLLPIAVTSLQATRTEFSVGAGYGLLQHRSRLPLAEDGDHHGPITLRKRPIRSGVTRSPRPALSGRPGRRRRSHRSARGRRLRWPATCRR
ncbi:hypothetical protein LCGC14_1469630, partial [marine sediment metagenome]